MSLNINSTELDYDHNWHERQYGGDEKLFVSFREETFPDEEASAEAGYKKFRLGDMITIVVPGDKLNIVEREVRQDDMERFAAKFQAYKAGRTEEALEGYPIKSWALVDRAVAEELRYLGFRTVEQIAGASSGIIGKYPGFSQIQARAKNWLDAQTSSAPMEKLQNQLEEQNKQMAAMQAQMAEMIKASASSKK